MRFLVILFLTITLIQSDIVDTIMQKGYPKLDIGEKRFKSSIPYEYKLNDFNFNWNVTFFTVVTFVDRGKKLKYYNLSTLYKTDNRVYSQKEKKDITYLANLFRKRKNYPFKHYDNSQVIIFIDNQGKMYAIENFKELKDMLGAIDTIAKLQLWIDLKYKHFNRVSTKLINNIWRVRFATFNLGNCSYKEYFRYYSKSGKYLKTENAFKYKEQKCPKVILMP